MLSPKYSAPLAGFLLSSSIIDHSDVFGRHLVALNNVLLAELGDSSETGGVAGEFREETVIVTAHHGLDEFGMVYEVEVVDDVDHRNVEFCRNPTVGGEEKIWLYRFEFQWDTIFKEEIPKVRMTCLRISYQGGDIVAVNKGVIVFPIKDTVELMFRMRLGDTTQRLIGKQPDTL